MIQLILVALLAGAPQEKGAPPPPPEKPAGFTVDQIVAQVEGEAITESEVNRRIAPALESLGFEGPEKEARKRQLWKKELQEMVLDRLRKQAAKKAKAKAPEREVEKRFKEKVKEVGSVPKMLRVLSNEGITLNQLEEEIQDTVRYQRFMTARLFGSEEIAQVYDIEVSPAELRAFYRTNREQFREPETAKVRHIFLVASEKSPEAERRALAQKLGEELRSGADMAELAKKHNPPGLAEKGGDLGWIRKDSPYLKVIRDFAFTHPEGALSGPLEDPAGIVLVKVEGRKPERVQGFEEAQGKIREDLREQKFNKVLESLREELLRDAYIWPPDLFPRSRR